MTPGFRPSALAPVLVALSLAACAPRIDRLRPDSGSDQTLVAVHGVGLDGGHVTWDGAQLPSTAHGAQYFSVPLGAAMGAHEVRVVNGVRTSAPATFDVTSSLGGARQPVIERVQLFAVTFPSPGTIEGWLFVQALHAVVGSEIVWDDGSAQVALPTSTQDALVDDLCGLSPEVLANPKQGRVALIAKIPPGPSGRTLQLYVTSDGKLSASPFAYGLPQDEWTLDSDGDGMPDRIELGAPGEDVNGDGIIDVDWPAMGADPLVPDLFVEVDIMTGLAHPPGPDTWRIAERAFAQAPVLHPKGRGIALHVDRGQGGPFVQGGQTIPHGSPIHFPDKGSYPGPAVEFDAIARPGYLTWFRYAIWADELYTPNGALVSGKAWGRYEFVVTMDQFPSNHNAPRPQAEVFLHELGHTLDPQHSGGSFVPRAEPNHLSVMSYAVIFETLRADRRSCWPCVQVGPSFSEGMARDLDETSLDEKDGVCGEPIDWNYRDGDQQSGIAYDVDDSGGPILSDHDNWPVVLKRLAP